MDLTNYLKENQQVLTRVYEDLKTGLQELGFELLTMNTSKGEYQHPSWATFRCVNESGEYNVSWEEPVDYANSLSYSHSKDRWTTGFYPDGINEVIRKVKRSMDKKHESLLETYNRTLNEALDNYHDQHKWEAFLEELEDCYNHGAHTEAYIEICKFFKYDDLTEIFIRLKAYRDKNGGYVAGSLESEEQYTTFEQMMDRLESEIPNEEDFNLIRSFI